jgi:hypothetical protein
MNSLPSLPRAALLAALLLCASVGVATAQTATPTPTEEELRLQEQKRLLELQRDIEIAKKAIRDAQPQPAPTATPAAPPTPTTTALAGDATLENVKLETDVVAYAAMSEAADTISDEVKAKLGGSNPHPPALAIYDSQVVKDWRFYQALFPAFEGQVKDLFSRYTTTLCARPDVSDDFKKKYKFCDPKALAPDPDREFVPQVLGAAGAVSSAFGAGTNLIKSFIDLAALFRTDTKITGNAVTIDESALVAEVFRALKNKYTDAKQEVNLYYPEVFPPRLETSAAEADKYSRTVTTIGALYLAKIEADRVIAKQTARKEELLALPKVKTGLERLGKLGAEQLKVRALRAERDSLERALAAETDEVIQKRIKEEIGEVSAALGRLPALETLNAQIDFEKNEIKAERAEIAGIDEDVKGLKELNERFQSFVTDFVKVDASGVNALALFVRSEDIENVMKESNSYWLEIKTVAAGGNNRTRKNLIRYLFGAKIDHSGGVIVEYTLYNKQGGVVYSDKLSYYGGYIEPKKIRRLVDPVP